MKYLLYLFMVTAILLAVACGPYVQTIDPSNPYEHDLGNGMSVTCNDSVGMPVRIFSDTSLGDVGRASATVNQAGYHPYIVLNPNVLNRTHIKVRMFWFAHECGHHARGHIREYFSTGYYDRTNESDADCFAVRTLRYNYGFSRDDIRFIASTLVNNPGSAYGHLPGPQRAQLLVQCGGY